MYLRYLWSFVGLVAISCLPMPMLWAPKRECDSVPGAPQDEAHCELLSREYQLPLKLDANNTAVHLRTPVPTIIDIPVYMHVVSFNPEAVMDGTLRQQLGVLNDDYAPSGIHFHLKGITRTKHKAWARHEEKLVLHKSLRVGSYSTLNLFYVDVFYHNHNNLATTTYPSDYAINSDDFWLDGSTIHSGTLPGGSFAPYNLGRTTTHEVGHWLGLYHTFEGGSCDGEGDYVEDTPVQAVAATKGCPTMRQDSCPGMPGVDDVSNFMDYADDACMDGFTRGQANRMHELWWKFREGR